MTSTSNADTLARPQSSRPNGRPPVRRIAPLASTSQAREPSPPSARTAVGATAEAAANQEDECGYEADFDPELERRYTCPVCLTAFRDPVQTKCGHRFCKTCLKKSAGGRNMRFSRCPVDNTWFDSVKEVFLDTAIKREVLSLTVNCPHKVEDCSWNGELRHLHNHSDKCPEAAISCPNTPCRITPKRKQLPSHLDVCPRRLCPCIHCFQKIPSGDLPMHQLLSCVKFPVCCMACGEPGILREDIPKHVDELSGDCPLVTVKCAFHHIGCYFQDKRTNMPRHLEYADAHHMTLISERLLLHEERLQQQERHLSDVLEKCLNIMETSDKQERLFAAHQELLEEQNTRLRRLETTSHNGELLWQLQVPTDRAAPINSPAFYTGLPGYKFHVTVEFAGHREFNKDFFSLFLCLERGEHDDRIPFPFDGTCSITLMDQTETIGGKKQHRITHVSCNQMQQCLSDGAEGESQRGRLKFYHLDDLLQSKYMKEGKIVILVQMKHMQ